MYIRSFSHGQMNQGTGLCIFLSVTSGVQNTATVALEHNTVMQLCTKLQALSLLFVLCFAVLYFVQKASNSSSSCFLFIAAVKCFVGGNPFTFSWLLPK